MHYLVNVDHNGMATHHTRSECQRFSEVLHIQRNGWDMMMMMMWNGSEEEGMKINTMTLNGKGR